MTGPQPTEDKLLTDLINTNRETSGETMSKKQYEKHGDYNPWQAANRFNSWNNAKASAGIYKENIDRQQISDEQLLQDLKQLNNEKEGKITVSDYKQHGTHSIGLIYNRFESFTTARAKAYKI